MASRTPRRTPSRHLRPFHFETACLLVLAAAAWLPSACGGSAGSAGVIGGETHFLSRCLATCDQGLACLDGICSVACEADALETCAAFEGAFCREVPDLGGGVCDVACSADAECRGRGDGFRCEGGYCRSPLLLSSSPPGQDAGGATTDFPLEAQCASYRDQPGQVPVSVVIVNQRSTPVYVDSADACNGLGPRYLSFDRPVLFPDARQACGGSWCQSIQDNGFEPVPCPGDCASVRLLRIDPGGRFEVGVFRSEGVLHGEPTSTTPRMPEACFERLNQPPTDFGVECESEVPLQGSYVLTASAFAEPTCPVPDEDEDEPCACQPNAAGYCVTGTSEGAGELTATATLDMPASTVEVVFR